MEFIIKLFIFGLLGILFAMTIIVAIKYFKIKFLKEPVILLDKTIIMDPTYSKKYLSNDPVENIGITFRLHSYKNRIIKELIEFMNSNKFHETLKEKFYIKEETTIISAIQKNLTGYEISPHPDIRQKCLTYLLNINNNTEIQNLDCNTHLMEFKDEYKHIQEYWRKNKGVNRCWVPWEWCNTIKTINENNSMVMFHPDNNPPTLHAIRLKYNHLKNW